MRSRMKCICLSILVAAMSVQSLSAAPEGPTPSVVPDAQKPLVIDGHRHVGDAKSDFSVSNLIEEMDRLRIDKAVIQPGGNVPKVKTKEWLEEDDRGLAEYEKANDDYFNRGIINDFIKKAQSERVDHSVVVNAIRRYPSRFVGVYMINPWIGEPELLLAEHAIKKQGFRGLKLHPQSHAFPADDKVGDPVLKLAERLKAPSAGDPAP